MGKQQTKKIRHRFKISSSNKQSDRQIHAKIKSQKPRKYFKSSRRQKSSNQITKMLKGTPYTANITLGRRVKFPLFNVNKARTENNINLYTYLFSELKKEQILVGTQDKNWQFIEIMLRKDVSTNYYFLTVNSPFHNVDETLEIMPTGNRPLAPDNVLLQNIILHMFNMIKNANMGSYIKHLLDSNKKVRVTMDYYVGRETSHSGFHKDTRERFGFYTTLTFDMGAKEIIPGPEITHYNVLCPHNYTPEAVNYKRQVVRPIIRGPFGTIGFNDLVLLHSTPYTETAENVLDANEMPTTIFNVPIPFNLYPGYDVIDASDINSELRQNPKYTETRHVSIKPSIHRTKYSTTATQRPTFIRCWFETFNIDSSNHLDYVWAHRAENPLSYGYLYYDETAFVAAMKPEHSVRNILKNEHINIENYEDLSPDKLNKIFEQTCELVENMG